MHLRFDRLFVYTSTAVGDSVIFSDYSFTIIYSLRTRHESLDARTCFNRRETMKCTPRMQFSADFFPSVSPFAQTPWHLAIIPKCFGTLLQLHVVVIRAPRQRLTTGASTTTQSRTRVRRTSPRFARQGKNRELQDAIRARASTDARHCASNGPSVNFA